MNNALKTAIIRRDGLTCSYCGVETKPGEKLGGKSTVIEHMTKDRSEDPACLCVSCRRCNSQKGNQSLYEWLDKIDQTLAQAEALKIRRQHIIESIRKLGERVHALPN